MRRTSAAAVAAWVAALVVGTVGCAPEDATPQQAPTGQDQPPASAAHPTSPSTSDSRSSSRLHVRLRRARPERPARPARPAAPAYSTWRLGVHVLPRAADGYGVVRPTPPSLRDRRYPTTDVLPPPADGGWHATVSPITPAVRRRMGATWTPGCPVPLSGLRYLTVSFRGFDGLAHTGELVVASSQARGVVSVFRTLFHAGFPIEEMRLPGTGDVEAPPTGDGNDTAGFLCRDTRGATTYSAHAYGLAIDLDPFDNPYHAGDVVLPERASSYLDRDDVRPGMVEPGDVAVRAFARIGWSWGGDFSTLKDYQHFTATGR